MKNRIYLLVFVLCCFFINLCIYRADCDSDKFEAELVYSVIDFDDYGRFVKVINLTQNTYVVITNDYNEDVVTYHYADANEDGSVKVYSPNIYENIKFTVRTYVEDKNCSNLPINSSEFNLVKYNMFSLNEVCDNAYGVEMCNEYYDTGDISEEEFVNKVQKEVDYLNRTFGEKVIDFIKDYWFYVVIPILLISIIFIFRIVKLKRGKKDE